MSYRVIIPTAGIGSRLEDLTDHINKSLVSVANKPIISHLIEKFPKTCEFVIPLGHKGELVKSFLKLAYPDKVFYFVNINPYKGKGSGLGYTLLSCKKYLQQPFVFISCDTLVKEKIPYPKKNWMGYSSSKNVDSYRTIDIRNKNVTNINEKEKKTSKASKAYIGLAGIFDYLNFWKAMKNGNQLAIDQGEAFGLKKILEHKTIKPISFTWFDTGNLKTLAFTRQAYLNKDEPNILEKKNEAIWFVGNKVIKFSTDKQFIKNRFIRAKILKGYVPKVLDCKKNMYSYEKIKGKVLSDVVNPDLFEHFLKFCVKFWKKNKIDLKKKKLFVEKCKKFYHDKTLERINLFYKNFKKIDGTQKINGEKMPTLSNLLKKIDWDDLSNGYIGRFHGDFHFENILWLPKKKQFIFLDWRQDFAGDLESGDIYYDLAKLLHGLIVSHELIVKNQFYVDWKDSNIFFRLKQKKNLEQCEKLLSEWCLQNNFSMKKIKILTSIIFLNIAALHHYPYSLFLFALGKSMLKKALSDNL